MSNYSINKTDNLNQPNNTNKLNCYTSETNNTPQQINHTTIQENYINNENKNFDEFGKGFSNNFKMLNELKCNNPELANKYIQDDKKINSNKSMDSSKCFKEKFDVIKNVIKSSFNKDQQLALLYECNKILMEEFNRTWKQEIRWGTKKITIPQEQTDFTNFNQKSANDFVNQSKSLSGDDGVIKTYTQTHNSKIDEESYTLLTEKLKKRLQKNLEKLKIEKETNLPETKKSTDIFSNFNKLLETTKLPNNTNENKYQNHKSQGLYTYDQLTINENQLVFQSETQNSTELSPSQEIDQHLPKDGLQDSNDNHQLQEKINLYENQNNLKSTYITENQEIEIPVPTLVTNQEQTDQIIDINFSKTKKKKKAKTKENTSEGPTIELIDGTWDETEELFTGIGKKFSKNSILIYEGQFKDSKFDGKGRKYRITGGDLTGGILYDGEFSLNEFDGQGLKFFDEEPSQRLKNIGLNDIPSYKGSFKKGMFHGTGTKYSKSGMKIYEGN